MELTVLLVEDDAGVRRVLRRMLERQGYNVLEAGSGAEAMVVSQQHRGPIELVITDVVMPDLNCVRMLERLKRDRPGLKALFMSGYLEDVTSQYGIVRSARSFLQKPFTVEMLDRKIRHVLNGKEAHAAAAAR